jgi:hypothetical protein
VPSTHAKACSLNGISTDVGIFSTAGARPDLLADAVIRHLCAPEQFGRDATPDSDQSQQHALGFDRRPAELCRLHTRA